MDNNSLLVLLILSQQNTQPDKFVVTLSLAYFKLTRLLTPFNTLELLVLLILSWPASIEFFLKFVLLVLLILSIYILVQASQLTYIPLSLAYFKLGLCCLEP